MVPDVFSDPRECIRKRGFCFAIPRRLSGPTGCFFAEGIRQECHDSEYGQHYGRSPCDGLVIPLALGFHPQMGAGLFKGGFDRPALDEVGQHLLGGDGFVRAEQGLGWELPVGVFDHQPADGHRGQPGVIPHGGVRHDMEGAFSGGIPGVYRAFLPGGLRIV